MSTTLIMDGYDVKVSQCPGVLFRGLTIMYSSSALSLRSPPFKWHTAST